MAVARFRSSACLWIGMAAVAIGGTVRCGWGNEPEIAGLRFRYVAATGIGHEAGVCRRDPSDVIRVGDRYYVYYTKVVRAELPASWRNLYPSGYPGTVWCAVSADGVHWRELGRVLGLGPPGAFDSFGVFTPNVLKYRGRYWLYYTAVRPTPGRDDGGFDNNSTTDPTGIGVAVADRPEGPFHRISDKPILIPAREPQAFDSYRVDDSCLLVRDGKIWLYYKGRSRAHGPAGPGRTQMGLAIAGQPEGPYIRQNAGKPVQDSGHEVQIWKHGGGVFSLVSPTGPNGRTLQYADDGLHFRVLLRGLKGQPAAPGLFRPELVASEADPALPRWGIGMRHGRDPHLIRFELVWETR
ncbi:MAG: family 43 glycosylhydrolase [Planctomycetes bacterium]|nr:family 43 glycosylhydrolase [Planctomycetota bacterium]